MKTKTPVTLVSGPLGSGKTTLLRHLLKSVEIRLAIVMNEFGEIGIDGRVLAGRNVQMTELDGGCVCCSLLGEFEAAVDEILEVVAPDWIVVETTGVAEPDALAFDIQESLPRLRLDGVVVVMDADVMLAFPEIGHTGRMQVEAADLILLNKIDLVHEQALSGLEDVLRGLNERAAILRCQRCRVDPEVLLGLGATSRVRSPRHRHQSEFDSFVVRPSGPLDGTRFEAFADALDSAVFRAKGFVRFADGGVFLFNFVAGRWELEPWDSEEPVLVFIGRNVKRRRDAVTKALDRCRVVP